MSDPKPSRSDSRRLARTCRRAAGWLPVVALLLGVGLAAPADARIYKYVDDNGDSHFTDSLQQVPLEYRHQVRDISTEVDEMGGLRIIPGPSEGTAEEPVLDEDGFGDEADFDMDSARADMVSGVLEKFGFGLILLVILAIPVLYVVSALVFKLSCRIAGEDPPGLGRACGILLAQGLAGSAVNGAVTGIAAGMGINEAASLSASIAVAGAGSILSWMVGAAILSAMMSYGFLKSMWIGFLHTLLVIVMVGGPIAALAGIGFLLA